MDCAVCLNHIKRQDEAFLYPCGHFFCFECIQQWTERQRQHGPDTDCTPGQRCIYTCPLCKTPYTYIVYECIGTSCRLAPMCGQPKTMSTMPLSAEQSRRRALYVTPAQLAPSRQVTVARRARLPSDKEAAKFIQRELQAVLLTEDVEIIQQHLTGVLQSVAKKQATVPSSPTCSAVYGDKQDYLQRLSASMKGFLREHSEQFAEQLWSFLHSGLSCQAYDSFVFGADASQGSEAPSGQNEHTGDIEDDATVTPHW